MRGFIKGLAVGLASFSLGFAVLSVVYEPVPASPPAVGPEALPEPDRNDFGSESGSDAGHDGREAEGVGVVHEDAESAPETPEPLMPGDGEPVGGEADPASAAQEEEPVESLAEHGDAAVSDDSGLAGGVVGTSGGIDGAASEGRAREVDEPAAGDEGAGTEDPVVAPLSEEAPARTEPERELGAESVVGPENGEPESAIAGPQEAPERMAVAEPEPETTGAPVSEAEGEAGSLAGPQAGDAPEAEAEASSAPQAVPAPPAAAETEATPEAASEAAAAPEPEAPSEPAPPPDVAPDTAPVVPPVLRAVPTSPGLDRAVEGVTVGRLPSIGRAPATEERATEEPAPREPADAAAGTAPQTASGLPPLPARERNAAAYDPAPGPLFAVILLDAPADPGAEAAIVGLPMPVAVALDPHDPDAPRRARAYRAAGHEVLIVLTGLPMGATASDLEVTFDAWFRALPEAVALMESPEGGFQGNRGMAQAIMPFLNADGYGLITFERGLNPVQQSAASAGVASTSVFRVIDGDDENQFVIRRYLDRATFRAQQEGRVVVVGRAANPETIDGLIGWRMEGRAGQVAIVPVSATLRLP